MAERHETQLASTAGSIDDSDKVVRTRHSLLSVRGASYRVHPEIALAEKRAIEPWHTSCTRAGLHARTVRDTGARKREGGTRGQTELVFRSGGSDCNLMRRQVGYGSGLDRRRAAGAGASASARHVRGQQGQLGFTRKTQPKPRRGRVDRGWRLAPAERSRRVRAFERSHQRDASDARVVSSRRGYSEWQFASLSGYVRCADCRTRLDGGQRSNRSGGNLELCDGSEHRQ